jgi:hypothetical protein
MIGLGTLNYALAQFDNLRIAPAPEAGPSAPK